MSDFTPVSGRDAVHRQPATRLVRRLTRSVAGVLLLSGCLRYVPAKVNPLPSPETHVRLTLAQPFDAEMGEFTLHDVTRIEGVVTEAQGDSMAVEAHWLYPRTGRKYDALSRPYRFPLVQIQQLEELRLSPVRTVVVLGAAVIALAVFLDLTDLGPGGAIQPPPPPDDGPIARWR